MILVDNKGQVSVYTVSAESMNAHCSQKIQLDTANVLSVSLNPAQNMLTFCTVSQNSGRKLCFQKIRKSIFSGDWRLV